MEQVAPLSWIAVGLASIAAIIQPFAALGPLFLGLIGVAMCLVAAGLIHMQRAQRDVEEAITLQDRWRAQRDRCGPCRVQLRETARATTAPAVLQNATPPPAPQQNENPVMTGQGRDLIFEEADQ